jgi:replicative superfamily II helicase
MEEFHCSPHYTSNMRTNSASATAELISLLVEAIHEARDWERFYRFIGQTDKADLYADLIQMRSDYLRTLQNRVTASRT